MSETRAQFGRVGFVGLGMMGLPMARHLADEAKEVLVHDVRPDAVAAAAEHPRIRAAGSLGDIASACDMVFTCLPGPDIVRSVHLDRGGLLAEAREGSIAVELSTTSPDLSEEIEAAYAQKSAHYVEAMMIGPPATAMSRQLFFILGGDPALRPPVEAALGAMGRGVSFVGGIGAASRAKLLHNGLGMIHMAATVEIMGLCMAIGVDPDSFIEVVRQSPKSNGIGYSTVFDLYAASVVHQKTTGTGKLYIAEKDLRLATRLAHEVGYGTPLLDEAAALFDEALRAGLGEDEYSRVATVVERRYGRPLFGKCKNDVP
jgi:3-hydroxyisobutyrate dehydrogenase-like beta-hydroxyacid dehydrogenase